jgi:molybdenum cofactor cytidylyltransferase
MIVLGAHEPEIRPGLAKYRILILVNPDPARGQISSMRLAAEHLDPQCQGCLIWPVDHPLVTPALVSNLIRLFLDTGAPLALPCCRGRAGHPAIFGPVLMQELLAAPPDSSPKLIVGRHRQSAALLETVETGTIEDIDTPEDYYRLTGETLSSVLSRRQAGGSIKGA